MSILIPGMEMPDNCYNNCPFFTQIQPGIDHGLINYCCLENWKKPITPLSFSVDEAKQGRQPFCPLVPVPPHGRLGDLDDFAKRMKNLVEKAENDGFDLGAAWYSAFVRHIELTPTIIQADKEEDG